MAWFTIEEPQEGHRYAHTSENTLSVYVLVNRRLQRPEVQEAECSSFAAADELRRPTQPPTGHLRLSGTWIADHSSGETLSRDERGPAVVEVSRLQHVMVDRLGHTSTGTRLRGSELRGRRGSRQA